MMSRMFIIARYPQTLRDPRMSHKTNIGQNHAAWQNNEEVICRKSLRPKDQVEASVILDVAGRKVVKNRFNENTDFDALYQYFMEHYADYINRWVTAQMGR
jgi:hypothetical protein